MRLDTYRCGCGKIETLPNLKAKPGPCTHTPKPKKPEDLLEVGPWGWAGDWMGWTLLTRQALHPISGPHTAWRASKKGTKTLYWTGAPGENTHIPPAFGDQLLCADKALAERRARAEAFFGAVRMLARKIYSGELVPNKQLRAAKFGSGITIGCAQGTVKKGDAVSVTVRSCGAFDVRRAVEESLRQSSSWRGPDGYALHSAMPGDALAYADLHGVTAYAIAHKQISKGDHVYLRGPNPRA